ncbi:MAG TPA: hypothetical protein VML75_21755 [Kofleriaceae bacterium]|nr:hypothetical protein [Kofleriaceae bacterium]
MFLRSVGTDRMLSGSPQDTKTMSDKDKKDQTQQGRHPVITEEVASRLADEAAELRREVRQRVAAMWEIGTDERQARSR